MAGKTDKKKLRSKFFRVAVEGATTDGRVIERQHITDMAASYDPQLYGARIWVEHLRSSGFTVRTTDVEDLSGIKTKHGVPASVQSCHTGVVDGYVVEGHVPAADIHRMLKERPKVAGIGAYGMPLGSPGMEVKGVAPQAYNVMAFDKTGKTTLYATH